MVDKIKSAAPIDRGVSPQTKALNNMLAAANAPKPKHVPKPAPKPEPKRKTNPKPSAVAIAASPPLKPRAAAAQPTLTQSEQRLSHYAKQHEEKADGKAGIQKLGDFFRKGVTGYGDHQFRNIGESQKALTSLKQQVRSGKLTQAQADSASSVVLKKFSVEEARVTKAQAQNAEIGKAVHGAGRVVVVGGLAVAATAAGGGVNVVAGAAAAAAAGSVYDAVTVADQGRSVIAPQLDAANSLGGVAMRAAKGKKVNGGDVARALMGTATDGVNGAFGAQGVISSRAKQLVVQQVAAQSGRQATKMALGFASVKAGVVNSLWQTGAATGMKTVEIAGNTSLTGKQKNDMASENAVRTLAHLPGQLMMGGVSSQLGPLVRLKSKPADALLQFALDGITNVAQTSISNKIDGKGFKLSKADLAAAFAQSGGGAIQNIAQRVPQRTAQQVLSHVGTMHPYEGAALTEIPHHAEGTTVVIGSWPKALDAVHGQRVVHMNQIVGTTGLWPNQGPLLVGAAAAFPHHVYRTFTHPLTGQRMAIKTNVDAVQAMGQRDQNALNKLTKKAGLSEEIPVKALVDETPSNLLPRTPADTTALGILKLGASSARALGIAQPKRNLAMPGEWLGHFLAGSGEPKIMSQRQVASMVEGIPQGGRNQIDAQASSSLQAAVATQMANGLTTGKLEMVTPDIVWSAPEKEGWRNVLGSFHVSVSYQGSWKLGTDGNVYFKGDKRLLVQDRYNWEAVEFNGHVHTNVIPGLTEVPATALKILPDRYLKAFSVGANGTLTRQGPTARSSGEFGGGIKDAMLAQLQMVQGGAQPFWTFGLSPRSRIELNWNPEPQ
jgi:hypothetical protein